MVSEQLYNNRINNSYIKYIKKCCGHMNIDELYVFAQIEPYEVVDQNHWFTLKQINLFHEKFMEMTGSINIARETS
jgi:two-component system, NtrC family, C4-dicarboxylate transport sensor histidine kinase DctB